METYPKIDTLFERDTETFTVIEGEFRRLEFDFISHWNVTEKIDGTNIRLIFTRSPIEAEYGPGTANGVIVWGSPVWEIRGRSDNAQIPGPLNAALTELCSRVLGEVTSIMEERGLETFTLYGEGYGPGIQKGGYYRDDPAFILFDVKADSSWLGLDGVINTSMQLGIDRVPLLDNPYSINREWDPSPKLWTVDDIVRYVKTGDCLTTFAKEQREAEGIIAKAPVPLFNNRGQRVMFKLKGSDFRAGKR